MDCVGNPSKDHFRNSYRDYSTNFSKDYRKYSLNTPENYLRILIWDASDCQQNNLETSPGIAS